MASVLIKPTKRLDAIETPITPCRYSQPIMRLRKIGIIEPEGSKWEYQCVKFVVWITFFEIGFALFDSFAIVNSYIAWKNHILKGRPKKHRAYKKYRAGNSFGVDRKMGQACYASLQGTTASCKKNEGVWYFLFRKLLWSRVTIEHKANPIRPESKHHDEPIELPFKSVWSCVMRETYQVALLGLYRGYWWYISSLPYERAAMQHGASPNSSGDLSQFVCKISLPKKIVNSMNKNWWLIIEMFYFFKFLSTPFLLYRKWIFPVFRCAPRAYSNLNIKFM